MGMFSSVLVAIDINNLDEARLLLEIGGRFCKGEGAEMHALTVLPDYGMPVVGSFFPEGFEEKAGQKVKTALEALIEAHAPSGCAPHVHVGHGTIYEEIIKTADRLGCDLIVVGSHRPELKDYLLGPNAARVARHARQSIFVVRSRGR